MNHSFGKTNQGTYKWVQEEKICIVQSVSGVTSRIQSTPRQRGVAVDAKMVQGSYQLSYAPHCRLHSRMIVERVALYRRDHTHPQENITVGTELFPIYYYIP